MDDEIRDEMQEMLDDAIADLTDELIDRMEEVFNDSIGEILQDALEEFFSSHAMQLKDGTVLQPRKKTKVLSPKKDKLLYCYGGLRVDGTSLVIQTRISCWEYIAAYSTKEEAVAALMKVKAAMEMGEELVELG